MAFSSLGKAPVALQCNPRWHRTLLEATEAAIYLAWTRLKEQSDSVIEAKDEDRITNELLKELRRVRKNGDIARFIPEIFSVPTRDSKVESLNGDSIDQMPDITIYPANPREVVTDETQDALFYECKVLDGKRNLDRYRKDGIDRFLDGRYAWAMPHAGMIAYVFERRNTCPVSSLQSYFSRLLDGVPIAELVGCEEQPSKVFDALGVNVADVALTRHKRKKLPMIDLRHLWLF
ncbi:hypothetical protein HCH_07035 [Hahella chejuensis KCTC 2396]|uniref:Uncharacterized protein n=1 Tax=Hahella chejuensis (strain KCTC 2396) TaxID=349521 RepID=Q2S6S4_HAHCH|nr:hypothetical protein [Hahella chejuensis]ABC33650.1 hypothetical protein HCH_07035 [Hahella chejuensis KCTC 2396]